MSPENQTVEKTELQRRCQRPPEVWTMFDRIAPRYDFLNRLLSFGADVSWRKKVARFLGPRHGQHVLDLATGTADQLLLLFGRSNKVKSGIGMDLAEKMLEIGRNKIDKRGLCEVLCLKVGDVMDIPTNDNQFDTVTISFGMRNVTDVAKALREVYRVLRPEGRLLVLEFSLPKIRLVCSVYLFYLRRILPRIGALVSGDPYAYRYLNKTIETFPCGEAFCDMLTAAGFEAATAHPMTFGVATIYQGDKPAGHRREVYTE